MRLHTATVDTVSDSKGLGPHGLISTETITDSRRIGSHSLFMHVRAERRAQTCALQALS